MAKAKKILLENIPDILEDGVGIISRQITLLSNKESLEPEESKILISYLATLQTIFKEYRLEEASIKKELKDLSQSELLALMRTEVKNK